MKLLIITQVIDTEHPILGFFHRWVEEFAQHCEQVHVICLQAGKHSLPANVRVYSLGKEEGKGKLIRVWRFYKLIWSLRHEYDNVFVHMNQVYVLLGGMFWRATKKQIGLWYMHGTVSRSLGIAEKMTHHIFTGSPESFRLASEKLVVTGHGIDTNAFTPLELKKDIDLITVGRITSAKNLLELIGVLKVLNQSSSVTLSIVGSAVTADEKKYQTQLESYIQSSGFGEQVSLVGRVNQTELPTYLNRAKIFVTTAQNGSLDKAILEAMACGLPVVSMAPGSLSLGLGENQVITTEACVHQIQSVLESEQFFSPSNVNIVTQHHSLQSLIPKILQVYS